MNKELLDSIMSSKDTYIVFNALKNMWHYDDEFLARVTYILGELNDCNEFMEYYDGGEYENEENGFEKAILDNFRDHKDSWKIDFHTVGFLGLNYQYMEDNLNE